MGFRVKIVFFLTNQKHPTKCEFINFISYLSNTNRKKHLFIRTNTLFGLIFILNSFF